MTPPSGRVTISSPIETAAASSSTSIQSQFTKEEEQEGGENSAAAILPHHNIRKRKLNSTNDDDIVFLQKIGENNAQGRVSSRLRNRPSSSNSTTTTTTSCGFDCSKSNNNGNCCCNFAVVQGDSKRTSLDDSNGNHYTTTTTTSVPSSECDVVLSSIPVTDAGSKKRKKHVIHRHDLEYLGPFHSSPSLQQQQLIKPLSGEPNRQSTNEERSKTAKTAILKKTTTTTAKTKENTKGDRPMATTSSSSSSSCNFSFPMNPVRKMQTALISKRSVGGGGVASRSYPGTPPPTAPLRWSNGWSWEGTPFQSLVHLNARNEDTAAPSGTAIRKCYPAMRHTEGDVVRTRDCILLKSGPKAKDLPFVAKVAQLFAADDGEMMMSLLWYYRPEHTDGGRRSSDLDDDIFASRHRDVCSVACVEDKCYVLTFNEYCRCVHSFFIVSMPIVNQ